MFPCCYARGCHKFLHNGHNVRFFHQTQRLGSLKGTPSFTRDDVPHKGLSPVPKRRRRVVDLGPSEPSAQKKVYNKERRPLDRHLTPKPHAVERRNPAPPDMPMDEFFSPFQRVSVASNIKRKPEASDNELPTTFTSPPLLPGLLESLTESLGPFATPTPIQSLSIKHILQKSSDKRPEWAQFLLASETGSGKSIAYLLPMLQSIKLTEKGRPSRPSSSNRPHNPRGLILAPTHELARQLSGFAKSLLHETKLRVMCASQANTKSMKERDSTSRKMAGMFDDVEGSASGKEFQVAKGSHPVDVFVGTPMKILEMFRGRGWDRVIKPKEEVAEDEEVESDISGETKKPRRGRDFSPGYGTSWSRPELGLANIEWVVIDEADVLFDSDFQATTRLLLSDISAARGHPVPVLPAPELESPGPVTTEKSPSPPTPISYPFNLVLTSATIPNSLNQYLENHHPSLIRLSSPNLHHLPKTLQTEYVSWSGGNKYADIHRRIRRVWAEDAADRKHNGKLSKILVFCNKITKVIDLCGYLEDQGVNCVPVTGGSEHRGRGSNRHLTGFLKDHTPSSRMEGKEGKAYGGGGDVKKDAHVMVTTSLLSRGLDFAPDIKHVFIVDEPRNMVDFLHRAGRSGRAGQQGKVVIFGKLEGRGSEKSRDVKRRVGALVS